MKKKGKEIQISRGESGVSLQEFWQLLFNKQITLKEAGIEPKLFTFWRREGLIDFVPEGKWARLNYIQVIWLKILLSLREFGYPLTKLKIIHEHFFMRSYKDNVAKRKLQSTEKELAAKVGIGQATEQEEERLEQIRGTLRDPRLLHILSADITYFSELLIECLHHGTETGILIFDDGSVAEYVNEKYYYIDEKGNYHEFNHKLEFHPPYIYVPLAYYIIQFLSDDRLYKYIPQLNLLSEDELRVLREMRNHNVREITIEINKGNITRIESTTGGIIPQDKVKEVCKLLGLKNYERITLETRDEKTVSFKKTRKYIKAH